MRYDEVRELLRQYFANVLAEHKERVSQDGRISPFMRHTFEEDIARLRAAGGRTPSDPSALALDWMVIEDILRSAGMDMPEGELRQRILKEYQAASLSYSEAVLSFDKSLASYDLNAAPQLSQSVGRTAGLKPVSLTKLVKQFRDFNTAQGLWTSSTALERDRHFDLLKELVGTDDASAVSVDAARGVRDALLKLPANRNKRQSTKELSVAEQIATTTAPRMQARTIKKHIQTYHGLFAWAAQEKQIPLNPFDGITVSTNARVLEGTERLPFSDEQLQRIELLPVSWTPR